MTALSRPLLAARRGILRTLPAMLLAASAGPAAAHTVWLEPDGPHGNYRVIFGGHEGKALSYSPDKVGNAGAVDATGKHIDIEREDAADGVRLRPGAPPALLVVGFDNGYWARTPNGRSVRGRMDEVPGAVSAMHALKYHKTIVQWSDAVTRPTGQPFELIPLSASAPRAGQPLQLQVLIDGKPAAGIKLAFDEEGADAVSDAQGVARIRPRAGLNRLWAGQRQPVRDDPRLTERSIEYSLIFTAR